MSPNELEPDGSQQMARGSQRAGMSRKRLLGDLLVKDGLITRAQLQDALRIQRESEGYRPIGRILIDQGLITQKQLDAILERYGKNYRLGDVLIEAKLITESQLQTALEHQRKTDLRLGEVLLHLNLVAEKQMREALATHLGIPFADLDTRDLDSRLARLINDSYARHHRVVPISATNDSITITMDDPSDLEVIEELRASTGRKIDVVTSTRAAFDRAFARVYGPGSEPALEWRYDELQRAYKQLYREHEEVTRVVAESPSSRQARPVESERIEKTAEEPAVVSRDEETLTRSPTRIGNLSGLIGAAHQMVTDWSVVVEAVERQAREAEEHRLEYERLERAHQALLATYEQLRAEFEASARLTAELEASHEKLLRERGGSAQSLEEMRERYEALLRDRQALIGELEVVLRRFQARVREDAAGTGMQSTEEGHCTGSGTT